MLLLNFNLNVISSVSLGTAAKMNILRKDEEGEKLKEEEEGAKKQGKKKCSLSLGCPFCHPISFASGLCLCGEGEGCGGEPKRGGWPSGAD